MSVLPGVLAAEHALMQKGAVSSVPAHTDAQATVRSSVWKSSFRAQYDPAYGKVVFLEGTLVSLYIELRLHEVLVNVDCTMIVL